MFKRLRFVLPAFQMAVATVGLAVFYAYHPTLRDSPELMIVLGLNSPVSTLIDLMVGAVRIFGTHFAINGRRIGIIVSILQTFVFVPLVGTFWYKVGVEIEKQLSGQKHTVRRSVLKWQVSNFVFILFGFLMGALGIQAYREMNGPGVRGLFSTPVAMLHLVWGAGFICCFFLRLVRRERMEHQ
jgi:hypothetical protein